MNDWHSTTLGKVLPFRYGKNLPKGVRSHTGEFAVVSSAGFIDTHSEALTKEPTVVIGRKGTVGSVFYCPDPVFPIDTTFYVGGSSEVNIRFAYYLLKSLPLAEMDSDAAVPGLNRANAERLEIRLPSTDYQQAIVEVLGSIDDLIENNRRRVQVLEEMARAIYREWFVKFRYPGHEVVPLIDSALGPIPEGWIVESLFDAAEVGFGYSFKSKQFADSGPFQVIRIRDIPNGISRTYTTEPAEDRYAVFDNDVLIGMDGDFHMSVWTGEEAWLNQRVTRLRPRTNLSSLHLMLAIEEQITAWNKAIVGTTVAHLGKKHLEHVTVLRPSCALRDIATEKFDAIMGQRRSLEQANRRLAAMRDLLLPKLITGQIDVSTLNLDRVLEEAVA